MDGKYKEGWFKHPNLGLIKIFINEEKGEWVYQCYTESGSKVLSNERPLDQWVWALSEPRDTI